MIRHKRARKSSFSLNPLIPWNLHSPTSPPVPFTFPSGGWHADSDLYFPHHWLGVCILVCVCVCVCVPGSGRWRSRSAVPWEMLFVAYRSTSRSMLSGLDRLRGWRHNSLGCRDLWKRMPSHAAAVFQPTSASRRLIFSAGVERTEEKFDEVLTSTYFLLCLACRFTNSFSLALVCLTGLPTISVIICISYFLIDRIKSN